jgi:hypothetical protein
MRRSPSGALAASSLIIFRPPLLAGGAITIPIGRTTSGPWPRSHWPSCTRVFRPYPNDPPEPGAHHCRAHMRGHGRAGACRRPSPARAVPRLCLGIRARARAARCHQGHALRHAPRWRRLGGQGGCRHRRADAVGRHRGRRGRPAATARHAGGDRALPGGSRMHGDVAHRPDR